MLNNSATFVVLKYTTMKTYLVKQHTSGYLVVKGVLKDKIFKADSGAKFYTKFLTKDEIVFNELMLAGIHADMLNHTNN
jgi:hypothetical protein